MSPGQCKRCCFENTSRAGWTGCLRFSAADVAPNVAPVLAGMLLFIAARDTCPGFEERYVGPDAYRSEDLPVGGGAIAEAGIVPLWP